MSVPYATPRCAAAGQGIEAMSVPGYNIAMHELGAAKDLFQIVIDKARENSLAKITKIRVAVGRASGIDPEFLRHSLVDHIMPETIAAGAALEFIMQEIALKCATCGTEIKPEKTGTVLFFNCPGCGGAKLDAISGGDVYVESIEGE